MIYNIDLTPNHNNLILGTLDFTSYQEAKECEMDMIKNFPEAKVDIFKIRNVEKWILEYHIYNEDFCKKYIDK